MASKKAKPAPRKRGLDPNSKLGAKLALRTEANLSPAALEFRRRFISEYLIDFNAAGAYRRAGGKGKGKQVYNMAYELTHEPYVALKIREAVDAAEEKELVNRNRVIAGLVREANYNSIGAQHGARVTAWSRLGAFLGMETKRVEANLALRGGVLVVPMTETNETWAERAAEAQRILKETVRT